MASVSFSSYTQKRFLLCFILLDAPFRHEVILFAPQVEVSINAHTSMISHKLRTNSGQSQSYVTSHNYKCENHILIQCLSVDLKCRPLREQLEDTEGTRSVLFMRLNEKDNSVPNIKYRHRQPFARITQSYFSISR